MPLVKALKVFKDLLSFLTIIPLGGKEDFIFTTASNMWLFPVVGSFIGLLGSLYFMLSSNVTAFLLNLINTYVALPRVFLGAAIPAAMTIAFLLVLTGLQHFDGLIDLGNALGLRNLHDRKMKAHAWTVTYAGAVLALAVEFAAVAGLFLINPVFAFSAIILAEVSAKLAMVTIVWIGKPSHKGLGSIFLAKAKKNLNAVAYLLSALIVYAVFYFTGHVMLGLAAVGLMFISVPIAFVMNRVSNHVFGGVSGDMIGATNETARAVTLILFALLLLVVVV
ncbi:MAG: adenosylcobinamide-GDP ribazoletransferase [Nitrososphaerota archaeon]|jgi:adenosylcobinamide-GDP ribazoletransferase|nr:adenosylcobinamide-GDP ribazoletransferase [Nitrososphaerota archaeon]